MLCCVPCAVVYCITIQVKCVVSAVFTVLSTVLKSERLQLVPVTGVVCEETWFGFSVCLMFCKSLISRLKRQDPRIDPCRTQCFILPQLEEVL